MNDLREHLRQTIVEVTESTCETLAFVFAMPPPDDGPDPESEHHRDLLRVRVGFDGPFTGSLALTMPRAMLPTLAANMLGRDEDATCSAERADAARELCNVICGNLLPAVAGDEPVFAVGAPRVVEEAPTPDSDTGLSARAWFDEGWIEAQLTLDGGLGVLGAAPAEPADGPGGLRAVA